MINIVLEIGTQNSKIGFASESHPRINTQSFLVEADTNKSYQQDEEELFATRNQRQFAYNLDTQRKDVCLEDIFQKDWQDEQRKLGLVNMKIKNQHYCRFIGDLIAEIRDGSHSECGIMIIESSNAHKSEINAMRSTICQYLLDELNLNSVYFLKSAVSTTFSQGSTSSIVIDSGENFTNIARVHDGYQDSLFTLNFGGNIINASIQALLEKKGLLGSFTHTQYERGKNINQLIRARELRDIKESLFKQSEQIQSSRVVEIQLPDQQIIKIDKENILEPFTRLTQYRNQSQFIFPQQYRGIHQIVVDLMEESRQKLKDSLSKHLIFTGGNFCYRDILNQAEAQIKKSAEIRGIKEVQLINNNHQLLTSWIGGSIVGSLSSFAPYWVTNKDWKQDGLSVVMKKCP